MSHMSHEDRNSEGADQRGVIGDREEKEREYERGIVRVLFYFVLRGKKKDVHKSLYNSLFTTLFSPFFISFLYILITMTCNQNEKMLQAQTLLYTTIDSQTMQLISILGIGAYGIVYLGQNILTGQNYAVKLLTHINVSRRETEIHAYLSGHPNILRFEKIVRENNKTFMIIEYTPEGDLFGAITQPGRGIVGNNDAIRHIFLQIIDAVQYCHQNNVFHRDLKPENIMLDSHWNVKLADFGLATTHQVSDEFGCGSTFYFSPGKHIYKNHNLD